MNPANQPVLIKAYGGDKAWRLGGIVWALQNDKRDPLKIDRTYSGANRMATYWPDRAAAAESMAATLKNRVATLEGVIGDLMNKPKAGGLDRELAEQLPRLLLVCHPDKHGNSQAATKATQWLLEVRGRLNAY